MLLWCYNSNVFCTLSIWKTMITVFVLLKIQLNWRQRKSNTLFTCQIKRLRWKSNFIEKSIWQHYVLNDHCSFHLWQFTKKNEQPLITLLLLSLSLVSQLIDCIPFLSDKIVPEHYVRLIAKLICNFLCCHNCCCYRWQRRDTFVENFDCAACGTEREQAKAIGNREMFIDSINSIIKQILSNKCSFICSTVWCSQNTPHFIWLYVLTRHKKCQEFGFALCCKPIHFESREEFKNKPMILIWFFFHAA